MTKKDLLKLEQHVIDLSNIGLSISHIISYYTEGEPNQVMADAYIEVNRHLYKATEGLHLLNTKVAKEKFNIDI